MMRLLSFLSVTLVLLLTKPVWAQERTWTDSTGKHKVKATFQSFDGETVELLKSDGATVSLPLNKLSRADQNFVKSQQDSDNPFAGGVKKSSSRDRVKPSTSASSVKNGNLRAGQEIFAAHVPNRWSYQPSQATNKPSTDKIRPCMIPGMDAFQVHFKSPLFFAKEKGLACIYHHSLASENQEEHLYVFQLASGKIKRFNLPEEVTFWGISPDGTRFLSQKEDFKDDAAKEQVDVYQFGNHDDVTLVHSFRPYAQVQEDYLRKTEWAHWVDNQHILTVRNFNKLLCLWDLKTNKAVYSMPITGNPTLNEDGTLMVVATEAGIILCETRTGKLLGRLSAETPILSEFGFSPGGTRLFGILTGKRGERNDNESIWDKTIPKTMTVWNLATGEKIADVSVYDDHYDACWVDERHIMKGPTLYDVETGIPLCYYAGTVHSKHTSFNGQFFYFVSADNRTALCGTDLPHPGLDATVGNLDLEEQFVLHPKTRLKLVLELNNHADDKVLRGKIEKKFQDLGFVFDENAEVKLVARIIAEDPVDVTYGSGGMFLMRGPSVDLKVTPYVSEYLIQHEGKTYWANQTRALPHAVPVTPEESLQDALKKLNVPNTDFFVNSWVPTYLSKTMKEGQNALTQAKLTANGVK